MNNKNTLFFSFSFLLFILSIIISPRVGFASTIVDQDITTNTTWTALGSPYLIMADVTVEDFTTLTIEPGTIIKFDYGYNIFVDGAVVAVGSDTSPITITSIADDSTGSDSNNDGNTTMPGPSDYGGFVFSFFSTGDFDYTNFKYGFISIAGSPDDLTLNNSNFTDNYLPLLIDYATNFLHENNSYTNNDLNGIGLSGVSFMQDVYLIGGDGTYLIFDDLTIDNGYTLTLDPGVVLKTGDDYSNISFNIYGQMVSLGTQSNIVCITSISDDSCGGDTQNDGVSLDPSYGGFYDIYFNSINQTNSIINYTDIKYIKGSGGIYVDGAQLHIDDSNFIGKYSTIYFYQSLGNVVTDSHFEDLWNTALDVSFDSTASITNTTIDMNGQSEIGVDIFYDSYLEIYDSIILNGSNGIIAINNGNLLMLDTVIDNMTNNCVGLFNYSTYNIATVAMQNNEMKNCDNGLFISDFVDLDLTNNKIHGNIYGAFAGTTSDITMTNNWWGSDTGPTHASNPSGTGDAVSDHIDFDPWIIQNPNPPTYYAKITNAPGDIGNMRETPSLNGVLIKTLPNDWVVHVVDTYENSPQIADGYVWYKIVDPTDGSEGYMIASLDTSSTPTFLPYIAAEQGNFQTISETQLTTKVLRAGKIVEAVNNYFTNSSTTKSLYNSDDHSNYLISKLVSVATIPQELVLAMAAQEDGPGFDNEKVTYDYGHGVMQLTFDALKNEKVGGSFTNNKVDPRGIASDIKLSKCRVIDPNAIDPKHPGLDEYKKCYQNTDNYNTTKKPYDFYNHDNQNPKYKQYANTAQSIYANIKDGLAVLRQKHLAVVTSSCSGPTVYGGYTFTCNDIKKVKTVWGYNGYAYDKTTHTYKFHYMLDVSNKLATLSTYFPGHTYANTDHLIQKLAIADANKEVIFPHTPQVMKVVDSKGNVTGFDKGIVKNDIPNSYYDKESGATLILFPSDKYTYEILGDSKNGTYGFDVADTINGEDKELINIDDVKINKGEVHRYNYDGKEFKKNVIIDMANIINLYN